MSTFLMFSFISSQFGIKTNKENLTTMIRTIQNLFDALFAMQRTRGLIDTIMLNHTLTYIDSKVSGELINSL